MSYSAFIASVQRCVEKEGVLVSVESLVAAASPNWTNEEAICLEIEIPNIRFYEHWSAADGIWIVRGNNGNEIHPIVAAFVVAPNEHLPLARVYFSQLTFLEAAIFLTKKKNANIAVVDVMSQEQLNQIVDADGAGKRIRRYQEIYQSTANQTLTELQSGRVANTFVTNVDLLDTGDRCFVCDQLSSRIMTMTIGRSDTGASSICFSLCQPHAEEANGQFLIEFLAEKFGIKVPFDIQPIEQTQATETLALRALKELDCEVYKKDLDRQTFYGRRKSGFEIILRCYTRQLDSYAYMVLTPAVKGSKQENVRRIDDAKDHPEQTIRWDHRHTSLPKSNKEVQPSFTFGMPIADIQLIKREVEEAEQCYQKAKLI
ncbi:hypothetical protein ACXZ1M_13420 [Duganella sp. PWIR1]